MTIRLPSSSSILAAMLTVGVAFLGAGLYIQACTPVEPVTPPTDGRAVLLAESLATARAEAAYNLQQWEAALQDRDTVVRRVVRYIARHDTAWATGKDSLQVDTVEVVRWLAVSDSTLRVVRDSLQGELVQCRFDATQCADELRERPTSCNGWSAFGWGYAAGVVTTATACVLSD